MIEVNTNTHSSNNNAIASQGAHTAKMPAAAGVAQWHKVLPLLEKEIGSPAIRNWIAPLAFVAEEDGSLVFTAPTRFLADWVRSHYADAIRRLWSATIAPVFSVDIAVDAQTPPHKAPDQNNAIADTAAPRREATPIESPLDTRLDPRYTFDSFITGPSNELAFAAAKRIAESHEAVFNPLFVYGGVGRGKTHLMHAIGWGIQQNHPDKTVAYMPAEKFMYQFIRALKDRDTVTFKDAFRAVDILMIDDIQFISGKTSTQQELIHTFNALLDQGKQIIICADKNPAEISGLDERLRSRLGGGLVVDIQPADIELRRNILRTKAEAAGKTVPENVTDYLAERIATNIRELEGALNRILAHADLMNRPVTLETTEAVLSDLFRAHDRKVTIDDIKKKTADFYGIKLNDMASSRRLRAIARPRQIAMYLAKTMTPTSLPNIGREFGGRDHTTVMHAVRKITSLMDSDPGVTQDVHALEKALKTI